MTIAVSVKVNDGIVLGADSAATMSNESGVLNTYNHANKIFNLRKGLPIGVAIHGLGSIGASSIGTLLKDFRRIITDEKEFKLKKPNYTIEDVTKKLSEFLFDKYKAAFAQLTQNAELGLFVVGYSSGADSPEEWQIRIENAQKDPAVFCSQPQQNTGISAGGVTEAVLKLFGAYPPAVGGIIAAAQIPDDKKTDIMNKLNSLAVSLVAPAMPIQDAIDLAQFAAETTKHYVRFLPGPPTVDGQIELAAITKHEGFKWVSRKHYFDSELNPRFD